LAPDQFAYEALWKSITNSPQNRAPATRNARLPEWLSAPRVTGISRVTGSRKPEPRRDQQTTEDCPDAHSSHDQGDEDADGDHRRRQGTPPSIPPPHGSLDEVAGRRPLQQGLTNGPSRKVGSGGWHRRSPRISQVGHHSPSTDRSAHLTLTLARWRRPTDRPDNALSDRFRRGCLDRAGSSLGSTCVHRGTTTHRLNESDLGCEREGCEDDGDNGRASRDADQQNLGGATTQDRYDRP
jgi:hypothetical protein